MKNIENFCPEDCTVDVMFTMIIRIKFTDLPNMIEVMEYTHESLKVRVDEAESHIMTQPDDDGFGRSGKVVKAKS